MLVNVSVGKHYYSNDEQALRALRKLDRQVRKRINKLKKRPVRKYDEE